MSYDKVETCACILRDSFNEKVEMVGKYLAAHGPSSLGVVEKKTGLSANETRAALRFLFKHNIVMINIDLTKRMLLYSISLTNVTAIARYDRYTTAIKSIFGIEAEFIVRYILAKGRSRLGDVITSVLEKLGDRSSGEKRIYDKFVQLVQTHFIQRCPTLGPSDNENIPVPRLNVDLLYTVPPFSGSATVVGPKRSRPADDSGDEPACKRPCPDNPSKAANKAKSDDVYWQVNFDRFNEFLRDQVIVEAIASRVDSKAAEVVRAILRLSEVKPQDMPTKTVSVSFYDIVKELPLEMKFTDGLLKQYLQILTDVTGDFVRMDGDSGGGLYSVNFQCGFLELCKAHIESVVQERYGSETKRILRILLLKQQLEMKQIEELATADIRQTEENVYRLLRDGFVSPTEILTARNPIFTFSVNVKAAARSLLERSYKTLGNLIARRMHETKENKRLIDKQRRMEAILAQISDPAQREEFEQQMMPAEKAQIEKFNRTITMLQQAELEVDETIFILETYIDYSLMKF